MFNGLWTVDFISTINRYGKGVLVLSDGRVLGGDHGYYYSGTYIVKGNNIQATISVIQYDKNIVSVFGNITHFQLTIDGEINEYQFSAVGTIANNPQVQIKVVGTKREDL